MFKSQYRVMDLLPSDPGSGCSARKYLGILLKNKGTMYGAHFRGAADKARRTMDALSGLMLNVGGPRKKIRRLLTSVVNSVLLYGTLMWALSLRYNCGASTFWRRSSGLTGSHQKRQCVLHGVL